MRFIISIICAIVICFLIASCSCNSTNFEILEQDRIVIKENVHHPIVGIPRFFFVNDSFIFFINDETEIHLYSLNSHSLKRILNPKLELDTIIKDTHKLNVINIYDIENHASEFIKSYSLDKYMALCESSEDEIGVFYYKFIPIMVSQNLRLKAIKIYLDIDFKGNNLRYRIFESDYFPDEAIGLFPNEGFVCDRDSFIYCNSNFVDDRWTKNTVISKMFLEDTISLNGYYEFPFPEKLYFEDDNLNESKTRVHVFADIRKFKDEIYFSNSLKIYNILSSKVLFDADSYAKDSQLIKILGFDLLSVDNNDILAVIIEDVKKPLQFGDTRKHLYIIDIAENKVLQNIDIGKNVGGIKCNGNRIYISEKIDDKICFEYFEIGTK